MADKTVIVQDNLSGHFKDMTKSKKGHSSLILFLLWFCQQCYSSWVIFSGNDKMQQNPFYVCWILLPLSSSFLAS